MAQSDQTVQNATFPAVRADINDNLAALYSQSSGNSAPTTTVAFQPWVDTSSSPPVYKIRNATNSGWITIGVLDTNFEVGGITPIANGGTGQTTASAAINALLPSQTGNSTKALTTDGTNVGWGIAGGGLIRVPQILTSGTSYTTPAGCTKVYVECVGGGQGGQGPISNTTGGRGGNSGGFCAKFYSVTESTSYTIAIGAGGAGSGNSAAGGNGGNTTFTDGTTLITAYGGATTSTAPTNGDITRFGGVSVAATGRDGTDGGQSYFQVGGIGAVVGSSGTGANGLYGSGGGGAYGQLGIGYAGGAGGSGMIRIWEYS
jgi:hypothetical protein